jgi:aryl-alcohol dehydrogenase-like predicted oxidoreductase
MEYTKLGPTGLDVSRICLGCMGYGGGNRGNHPWSLGEEESGMLPLCATEGIGVTPWSPQARGKLTLDWNYTSIRTETDEAFGRLFAKTEDADHNVVDREAQVAAAPAFPAPRWHSPGYWLSRLSPRPLSAPPSSSTSTTHWPRFASSYPTTK